MARGALAAHLATIAGCNTPSLAGRSKKNGGFLGFGDQAAALASVVKRRRSDLASSTVLAASSAVMLSIFGVRLAPRQQELIAYKLENASGCFMPTRMVP